MSLDAGMDTERGAHWYRHRYIGEVGIEVQGNELMLHLGDIQDSTTDGRPQNTLKMARSKRLRLECQFRVIAGR